MKKIIRASLVLVVLFGLMATAHAQVSSTDLGPFTLRQGTVGIYVVNLQNMLNTILSLHLTADGRFGAQTKTAVQAFQVSKNIKADGLVGRGTKQYLNAVMPDQTACTPRQITAFPDGHNRVYTGIPDFEITSPGAGTVFHSGDSVTVKWIMCHTMTSHNLVANISMNGPTGGSQVSTGVPLSDLQSSFVIPQSLGSSAGSDQGTYSIFMSDGIISDSSMNGDTVYGLTVVR